MFALAFFAALRVGEMTITAGKSSTNLLLLSKYSFWKIVQALPWASNCLCETINTALPHALPTLSCTKINLSAPWHCFWTIWMHEDGTRVRCSAGLITQPSLGRVLLCVSVRPSIFRVSIPNFIRAIVFELAPLRGRPQKACLMLKFVRSADGNRPPF